MSLERKGGHLENEKNLLNLYYPPNSDIIRQTEKVVTSEAFVTGDLAKNFPFILMFAW